MKIKSEKRKHYWGEVYWIAHCADMKISGFSNINEIDAIKNCINAITKMKKLEWYKFPPVSTKAFYGTIVDWNQTLVTMLNVACNGVDKSANVIAAESCRPIIESLEYYNNNTSRIGNRFYVSFSNEIEDSIICECDENKTEIILVNDNYPSFNY